MIADGVEESRNPLEQSSWILPPAEGADADGLVAVGADLEAATLLDAYRNGIFPMPVGRGPMAWWSPDPRAILPFEGLRISRSLRRARSRFDVRVDSAFADIVAGCADPRRPQGWITPAITAAYCRLHELGSAHSIEAWSREDGSLAGGLYGVAIGGFFAGESMFHRARDASKVALLELVGVLTSPHGDAAAASRAGRLLDVQWATPHLRTLGAVEISRSEYLRRLRRAVELPAPDWAAFRRALRPG
ncbi:MAG TPA: leucyl/phenylalanyl-tRNA--protein transferase [Candidatus Dormibacteraeota bacterium]|nr:leucyl/phenylalanyl-tRNA--protein transferase [Candidatus Dormibacteraeota bacterium]